MDTEIIYDDRGTPKSVITTVTTAKGKTVVTEYICIPRRKINQLPEMIAARWRNLRQFASGEAQKSERVKITGMEIVCNTLDLDEYIDYSRPKSEQYRKETNVSR